MEDIFRNYVYGKWVESNSGKTFANINPANTNEAIGHFQRSTREDVKRAMAGAQEAYLNWKDYSPYQRSQILEKALHLLEEKKEGFARTITREEGKTLKESEAEVRSAIKEMKFQIEEGKRLYGETVPSERGGLLAYTLRQPLGVVTIITPWNFPLNVATRKITPALMAGNTVVFKPASFTPLTGLRFMELMIEAGLPEGVINFITGSGAEVGSELVNNPAIQAISFTGSTEVGQEIYRQAAKRMVKVQLEMGGKNAALVLEDADRELAANDISLAAYNCSGQWCTSTSRAIIMKNIEKEFTELLLDKARRIKVGNGLDPQITMGPLAGKSQLERALTYIEAGKREGAKLLLGGHRLTGPPYERGFFLEPTIFSEVTPEMRIAQEEIFGPILSLITVGSFQEALEVTNEVRYGLSSSIYTGDLSKAQEFIKEIEVGLTHVNLPTSYKEPQLPFGGIKYSGAGLPEGGKTGMEFFTEHKTVYLNYG